MIDYYEPDMVAANDYYPFGMLSRVMGASDKYKFGFNGKEADNEVKGRQNQQDYGFRIYDPRVGRFLSVDPITKEYPELTPYQFASNTPIFAIDLDGLEMNPAAMSAGLNYLESQVGVRAMNGDKEAQAAFNSLISARIKIGFFQLGIASLGTLAASGITGTIIRITTSPAVMASASTIGTVVAKFGPDAVNFVYGITTGDVLEPIPTGTGMEAADVGAAVQRLFKSPVRVGGFLKNAGAETVTLIKGTNEAKVAVIGQGMAKVKEIAGGLKNAEVFAPSKGAIDAWENLLKQYNGKLIPDDVIKTTQLYKENVQWINGVKKAGYDILDTGGGTTSTFYNMEKQTVYGGTGQ